MNNPWENVTPRDMGFCPGCESVLIRTLGYERTDYDLWYLEAECPDCQEEFCGQVCMEQLLAIIEAEELGILQIMLEASSPSDQSPENHT